MRRDRDEIAYCILFEVDANSIKTRRNQQAYCVYAEDACKPRVRCPLRGCRFNLALLNKASRNSTTTRLVKVAHSERPHSVLMNGEGGHTRFL